MRDKVLAARRGGIQHVLLPSRNRGDLEELPKDAAEGLRFTFVDTVLDVLFALFPAEASASAGDGVDVSPESDHPSSSRRAEEAAAAGAASTAAGTDAGRRGSVTRSLVHRHASSTSLRHAKAGNPGKGNAEANCEWHAEYVTGKLLESFL